MYGSSAVHDCPRAGLAQDCPVQCARSAHLAGADRAITREMSSIETPTPSPEAQRLFIAVRLPPATANQLATTADQLARRASNNKITVRWVEPVNYHITLAYLGWARPHAADAVHDVVDEICRDQAPFELRIGKLGGFPDENAASVIWAGVEDASGALQRPFVAHVTLGRLSPPNAISDLILPWREQMFSTSVIGSVELLDSNVKTGVYVYSTVMKKVLIGAQNRVQAALQRQTDSVNRTEAETDDGWPKGQGPSY
jgi:2'-5' RNA ligase